jgi:hypothetical protein
MSLVVLQPAGSDASRKHYNDTIESPVDQARLTQHLPQASIEEIGRIYGDRRVPVWGVTRGKNGQNAKKWERLNVGDITFFVQSGEVFASAILTHKIHSHSLAVNLWGVDKTDMTWEHTYFVDEITPQAIPVSELNRIVGYKVNNVVQGFTVLNEVQSDSILDYFDLTSSTYVPPVSEDEYNASLEGELDLPSTTRRRKEQAFLKSKLFGKSTVSECCICGCTLPTAFLVTAHIKKRSVCNIEERKDFRNIVAPMCKLGCDEMYERGYIYIDEGIVRLNESHLLTDDLKVACANLIGNSCSSWRTGTEGYFRWHSDQAKKI